MTLPMLGDHRLQLRDTATDGHADLARRTRATEAARRLAERSRCQYTPPALDM
jgi:hypothetical protein